MTPQTTPSPAGGALPQPFGAAHFAAPYASYARLRAEAPVHRVALPDGTPVWLVLREADVRAGLADPRLSVDKAYAGDGYQGFSLPPALDANLLNMDGAAHQRLRRLVSTAFTPRRVERLRGRVREAAERLADDLEARARENSADSGTGTADLVDTFSTPLPLSVIGDLLDVPEADRRPFSAWIATMLVPEHPRQIGEAVKAVHASLLDLVADRRAYPGDDLLSALIAARDDGDRLSEDELVSLVFLLVMAGIENVQHLIGAGVLTLLSNPDQLAALRADPERLMAPAVEELQRYALSSHMAIRRFPTEPVTLGGVRIPAGDTVLLCLASAHRDPERYADPERFDITREDGGHLALGLGAHHCLGAPLARLQLRTAFGTLLRRFPGLALASAPEDAEWRSSFHSYALRSLPVTLGTFPPPG